MVNPTIPELRKIKILKPPILLGKNCKTKQTLVQQTHISLLFVKANNSNPSLHTKNMNNDSCTPSVQQMYTTPSHGVGPTVCGAHPM